MPCGRVSLALALANAPACRPGYLDETRGDDGLHHHDEQIEHVPAREGEGEERREEGGERKE